MKKNKLFKQGRGELFKAFTKLRTPKEAEKFLIDILTPQELDDLVERWLIVRSLLLKKTQREVRDLLGIAISTVTRGARQIRYGTGGFQLLMKRLGIVK